MDISDVLETFEASKDLDRLLALPPAQVIHPDDFRALTVGLSEREFDASGAPCRRASMREGFEARLRIPRVSGGRFLLEFEAADPQIASSLVTEPDYEPTTTSVKFTGSRYFASGRFRAAPRDILVLFFRLPTSAEPLVSIPWLRVYTLRLFCGL